MSIGVIQSAAILMNSITMSIGITDGSLWVVAASAILLGHHTTELIKEL